MKKEIKDERVILTKRKIQSDGFWLVWLILLISVIVQQYLEAPVSQYIVEIVIWFAMTIYSLIFNIAKGNDLYPTSDKKSNSLIIVQSIVSGFVIATINTIQNYYEYGEVVQDTIIKNTISVAVISFISATLSLFVVLKVLFYFNGKKQQKIKNELNDDE